MERLILFGQDLISLGLVTKTPQMNERKTFKRDKLISNDFDFECYNKAYVYDGKYYLCENHHEHYLSSGRT